MGSESRHFYEFGPYRMDPARSLLLRGDEPVALTAKAFETLLILIEHTPQVVSKDELMKRLWPDTFVEEANLTQHISMVRRALGETPQEHRYIVTQPGRGYRFAEPVRIVPQSRVERDPESRSRHEMEMKGDRETRWRWSAALVLLGLAAFAGLAIYFVHAGRKVSPQGRVMLAVLPFQNLSNDPRAGIFQRRPDRRDDYRPGRIKPGEARRHCAHFSHIRVKDQTHIWAQSYDRKIHDFLGVQNELGDAITQQIEVSLTPEQKLEQAKAHRIDPEAYDEYLRGRYFWNKFNPEALEKSIDYFQRAIEKDPGYAQPYAGLTGSYGVLMDWNFLPPAEGYRKSGAAARKAVELDNGNSDAHAALGWQLLSYDRDFPGAETELRRAIELNASNADAHEGLANYFVIRGQFDQALAEMKKARELDPLSIIINSDLGKVLFYARRYDQAIRQCQSSLELQTDSPAPHYTLFLVYQAQGMYEEAYEEFVKEESAGGRSPKIDEIEQAHARSGWRGAWQRVVEKQLVSTWDLAGLSSALGDKRRTLDLLEKAADERLSQVIFLNVDPRYDSLRSDPRFQNLVRRIGLPPQSATGGL